VKTTMLDAGAIMRAFRAKKDNAGQSVFTVENHPVVLAANPEQKRNGPGKQGPVTACITVFMVHVIKNGLPSKKEAYARTNVRNQGHTNSVYHANTNIIDDALERTETGYNISLAGAKEIIDRYSNKEDYVVDLHCEKGWTAVASTCLEEARVFIGCLPNEAAKERLNDVIANSLIYQVGVGKVTLGMDLDEDLKAQMKSVYDDHEYDRRYNRVYGLKLWTKLWKKEEELPKLGDIPAHILDYVSIMRGDLKFSGKRHGKTAARMADGIGGELAQMEAEEPLRWALITFGLFLDKKTPYSKEGLRSIERGQTGQKLGYMSGIFVKGGWKENRKVLQDLGTGLFEYDEYVVENKSIPIEFRTSTSMKTRMKKTLVISASYLRNSVHSAMRNSMKTMATFTLKSSKSEHEKWS